MHTWSTFSPLSVPLLEYFLPLHSFASFCTFLARVLCSLQVFIFSLISSGPSPFVPHSLSMFLLLSVYLSEQHKLGELPRQHKAQVGDAQSDHGCPARIPCPGERRETEEEEKKMIIKWCECGWEGDKRKCIKTAKKIHTQANTFNFTPSVLQRSTYILRNTRKGSLSVKLVYNSV